MAIVYQKSKNGKTTYAYQQTSVYDPSVGYSRTSKKILGKLDPSGNIVPTGKVGRPRKKPQEATGTSNAVEAELERTKVRLTELALEMKDSESVISRLREENARLTAEKAAQDAIIIKLKQILGMSP